jgi:REP element-mobilizing transposase RayT
MPNYLRPKLPGAQVFFTAALVDRGSDVLVREVGRLRAAVREVRVERPFGIDAWEVLPDHMHAVWTLPDGDADFSTRWAAIKARFTRSIRDSGRVGFHPTIAPDGRRSWYRDKQPRHPEQMLHTCGPFPAKSNLCGAAIRLVAPASVLDVTIERLDP